MIYAHKDPRICGTVLLNPWLRSDQAMGKTMLKYYYLQRLMSKDFWRKLLGGKVKLGESISDAKGFAQDSMSNTGSEQGTYQQRMEAGLQKYQGPVCLILSGVDLTAKEFEQQAFSKQGWKRLKHPDVTVHRLPSADHTFSSKSFKEEVERHTLAFIHSVSAGAK